MSFHWKDAPLVGERVKVRVGDLRDVYDMHSYDSDLVLFATITSLNGSPSDYYYALRSPGRSSWNVQLLLNLPNGEIKEARCKARDLILTNEPPQEIRTVRTEYGSAQNFPFPSKEYDDFLDHVAILKGRKYEIATITDDTVRAEQRGRWVS